MADAGLADGARLAIRGGSAGGYCVLQALTTSETFAAGTSLFGIGDLLLRHGSDDLVVPHAQATSTAMTQAGKDVELVVYEGEGHGFWRADTIVDAHERELAFYLRSRHLAR